MEFEDLGAGSLSAMREQYANMKLQQARSVRERRRHYRIMRAMNAPIESPAVARANRYLRRAKRYKSWSRFRPGPWRRTGCRFCKMARLPKCRRCYAKSKARRFRRRRW
jgi:hypothetical protein